jgi:hypothetical protein
LTLVVAVLFPSCDVAVIVTLPAFIPFMIQEVFLAAAVATPLSLLEQLITLLLALAGLILTFAVI